jgi:hypothetical protein
MLLETVKQKNPAVLLRLALAAKPSTKLVDQNQIDPLSVITTIKQSFDKLHWIYKKSPNLGALNVWLRDPELTLSTLITDMKNLNMTADQLENAAVLQNTLLTLRVISINELFGNDWNKGFYEHAYQVLNITTFTPEKAVILSNDAIFSSRGEYKIVAARKGETVKAIVNGFQIDVPEYSVASREDLDLLTKYRSNLPQIQAILVKVADLYRKVLDNYDQIQVDLVNGSPLPNFVRAELTPLVVPPGIDTATPTDTKRVQMDAESAVDWQDGDNLELKKISVDCPDNYTQGSISNLFQKKLSRKLKDGAYAKINTPPYWMDGAYSERWSYYTPDNKWGTCFKYKNKTFAWVAHCEPHNCPRDAIAIVDLSNNYAAVMNIDRETGETGETITSDANNTNNTDEIMKAIAYWQ